MVFLSKFKDDSKDNLEYFEKLTWSNDKVLVFGFKVCDRILGTKIRNLVVEF